MFAGRARDDEVLLTTFAGGRRNPEIAASGDRELAGTVATELAQLVGASGPRWCEITRWRRAIPQYDLGHGERVAAVEALEQRVPGLWWRANYRGGVSVGDCIKSAHATADAVATFLRA